jgi:hypothetical protein
VELVATPAFPVARIELEVRDGDDPPAPPFVVSGGGDALPQSLRLLVDGPRLALRATAYEPNGEVHQRTQSLEGLRAGASGTLTVDLSQLRACPPPPKQLGETVVYGDAFAPGWEPFGFGFTPVDNVSDAERCSGTSALRYRVTRLYDGLGFNVAPAMGIRSISFRVFLPKLNSAQVSVGNERDGKGINSVLPTPEECTFNGPGPCDIPLVAGWQRVFVEVPAGLGVLQSMIIQLRDPFIDPFELFIDDVRIALRP